jgi:hypothetical protein
MVIAVTRLAIMKEKRIPKAPKPIVSRIYAIKNLATLAAISRTRTVLAFEIPSNAKRLMKVIGEKTSNAMATNNTYPSRDA